MRKSNEHKVSEVFLLIPLVLSGFFGGIGFFTLISNNPTVLKMSDVSFAEYWKHLDSYMAARMRIFGPLLLLSIFASLFLLYKNYSKTSFWLMLGALFIILVDLFISIRVNHPLNQLIQSWDLQHLPANVGDVRDKVVESFYIRSSLMISSFILVCCAFWQRYPLAKGIDHHVTLRNM